MINTHLPNREEYEALPKSTRTEIAEEVYGALLDEALEDEHGFEYMDVYFLHEYTSKVQGFSKQQKLEVADDGDLIEQAKGYFTCHEEKLAELLGITPSQLEQLNDDNASEDSILKIVNYFIKDGDYDCPIKYDLVRVLTEDKKMYRAYKLYALDFVFNTWGEDRIMEVWEKVKKGRSNQSPGESKPQ